MEAHPKAQISPPGSLCCQAGLVPSYLLCTTALSKQSEKTGYSQPGRQQRPNYVILGLTNQYCLPCCSSICPSGERFYSLCSHLLALPEIFNAQIKPGPHITENFQFICASLELEKSLQSQAESGGQCAGRTPDITQTDIRQVRLHRCSWSRESPFAKGRNNELMSLFSLLTCTPLLSSLSLGRLTTGCFPQFKAILKKRAGARGWQRRFDSSLWHTLKGKIFHIKGKDWEKKITEIST